MPAKKSRKRSSRRKKRSSYKSLGARAVGWVAPPRKSRKSSYKKKSKGSRRQYKKRRNSNKYDPVPKTDPFDLPYRFNVAAAQPYPTGLPGSQQSQFMNNYAISRVGDEWSNPRFLNLQRRSSTVMQKPALRSYNVKGRKQNEPLLDAQYCGTGTLALGTDKGVWMSNGKNWSPCKGGAQKCYDPNSVCDFYRPNPIFQNRSASAMAVGQGQGQNLADQRAHFNRQLAAARLAAAAAAAPRGQGQPLAPVAAPRGQGQPLAEVDRAQAVQLARDIRNLQAQARYEGQLAGALAASRAEGQARAIPQLGLQFGQYPQVGQALPMATNATLANPYNSAAAQ